MSIVFREIQKVLPGAAVYGVLGHALQARGGHGDWTVQIWRLARHFNEQGLSVRAILASTDAELLEAKGFGPKALAKFRQVVPAPKRKRPRTDPWVEHAEMVAGIY